MDTKIVIIYCVCSDFLKRERGIHSFTYQMSNCEVLTFSIVSALFFYGNHEKARQFLKEYNYFPHTLSKSQLNRRLHAFDDSFWKALLNQLTQSLQFFDKHQEYSVDSFPVSSCETSRILRAKIFKGKEYHGYNSSKQRYFYGIKVHMIVTAHKGIPIEILFTPGSENDVRAFKRFSFDLPKGSMIYADRAYNCYEFEDFLSEHGEIKLIAQRRKASKRPLNSGCIKFAFLEKVKSSKF